MQFGFECGMRRPRAVFGQDFVVGERANRRDDGIGVAVGQGAIFPGDARLARQDVHRRSAFDHIGLHRGEGRIETRIRVGLQFLADVLKQVDELARHHHGIGAFLRRAGMAFLSAAARIENRAGFVRAHDFHAGRLADDGERGFDARFGKIGEQSRHAGAADFFVIGKREMDRPFQLGGGDLWQER